MPISELKPSVCLGTGLNFFQLLNFHKPHQFQQPSDLRKFSAWLHPELLVSHVKYPPLVPSFRKSSPSPDPWAVEGGWIPHRPLSIFSQKTHNLHHRWKTAYKSSFHCGICNFRRMQQSHGASYTPGERKGMRYCLWRSFHRATRLWIFETVIPKWWFIFGSRFKEISSRNFIISSSQLTNPYPLNKSLCQIHTNCEFNGCGYAILLDGTSMWPAISWYAWIIWIQPRTKQASWSDHANNSKLGHCNSLSKLSCFSNLNMLNELNWWWKSAVYGSWGTWMNRMFMSRGNLYSPREGSAHQKKTPVPLQDLKTWRDGCM